MSKKICILQNLLHGTNMSYPVAQRNRSEVIVTQADDGLNALRLAYPLWAFWHVSGRLGAIHRQTGVIIDAPEHAAWAEVLTAVDAVLTGDVVALSGGETSDLGHRVEQPLIPQLGDDLTGGAAGYAELLDESRLRRDGLARAVDADSDAATELIGYLHPHGDVGTEVDHGENVVDHDPA